MKKNLELNKGFTLIELLVVIGIISVLSTLLMVNFVGIRQRARDGQRKSDLRQVQSALEMYRADHGSYPLTAAFPDCNSTFQSGTTIYMSKVPCDPITNGNYNYVSAAGTTYSLIACLENTSDSQKDSSNNASYCNGSTNWSFTLNNP